MANGRFKCEICGEQNAHRFRVESVAHCFTTPWQETFDKRSQRQSAVCDGCRQDFVSKEIEAVSGQPMPKGQILAKTTVTVHPIHEPEEIWDRMSADDREMWSHGIGKIDLDSGFYERR